jgi:hypothetical protein
VDITAGFSEGKMKLPTKEENNRKIVELNIFK